MKHPVVLIVGAAAGALLVAAVGASAHSGVSLTRLVGIHAATSNDEASGAREASKAREESPEPTETPETKPTAEPTETPTAETDSDTETNDEVEQGDQADQADKADSTKSNNGQHAGGDSKEAHGGGRGD